MQSITVQGKKASFRQWGSGSRTIVMLHGWPADSSDYEELGPALGQKGYMVIVPDLPGWGETPSPEKPWAVSDYRQWVHDFIHALELKDFTLFGHSFGGRIAIKYAIKYPYDPKLLILCASAGIKPDALTIKRRLLKMSAGLGKQFFRLPLLSHFSGLAKKVLYKAAGTRDYLNAEGVMKETIVKVLDEDLTPYLPQIRLLTLLIWGTEDTATPFSDADVMAKRIPRTERVTIEGARHNLPKQQPKQVADAVDRFIREHADAAIV